MKTQGKRIANTKREKRKLRIRASIQGTGERPRLSIFRSSKHMYAQLIADDKTATVVSASTLEKEVLDTLKSLAKEAGVAKTSSKSVLAAKAVGVVLAKRTQAHKIKEVVFDRNGFIYCGRVQAVADGAREGGLIF